MFSVSLIENNINDLESNLLFKGVLKMECLSNQLLLETFQKAKQLDLDDEFIELIELEIYRRNLKKQLIPTSVTSSS